ncbi:hypothetical protein EGI31_21435 [Lacihabitans soyangensis]|uniref:Uncharacterized protein n=1 Tax=Lacihabitans soyangensis TaxID=869394 RepID=A0AAE3H7H0_9BACT|nr:hypothetical protein [Lacihabitans soyangensis]
MAGVNIQYHFKKVFIYDDHQHSIIIDWKMSKNAVNLMVTQMAQPDQTTAQWIWKLVNMA